MGRRDELVVGLDIGTTKTCAIVGEVTESGVDIIGIGTCESKGLRKGVVVNIESTIESIKRAVAEAELMAGCEISSVYAGIAGAHVKGLNSRGIVAVREQEVSATDLDRVLDAAKAVAMPLDRDIIHILPQEYVIDDCDGVREPIGMSGVRLEAKVHVVTATKAAIENIRRCATRAGLHVEAVVLAQLASGTSALFEDEKELGVALVDIGGGTTDIAIYFNSAIVHTAVLPVGGQHVTTDIAVGLRTPHAEAEKIKQAHGCALTSLVGDADTIEVPSVGGREPQVRSRQLLCDIIEPRVEEMYRLIHAEIRKSGFEDLLASGVVITGGTAVLPGMVELGEEVMGLPVRLGQPGGISGLTDVVRSPKYSTGVGLVLYGAQRHSRLAPQKTVAARNQNTGVIRRVSSRIAAWFAQVF
jgi:cell division protein FtsA